jgi:hypothetical protein
LAPAAPRHRLAEAWLSPKIGWMRRCPTFRFADLAALQELTRFWLDDPVPGPVTAFGGLDRYGKDPCRLPVAVLAGRKLGDIAWPLGCVPVSVQDARTLRDPEPGVTLAPGDRVSLLARTQ